MTYKRSSRAKRLHEPAKWHHHKARFTGGRCGICGGLIKAGNPIVKIPAFAWVHDTDCLLAAEAQIRANQWQRCGAYTTVGHPCRNWVNEVDTRCGLHTDQPIAAHKRTG